MIAGYFVAGLLGLAVVVGIGRAIAGSGGDGEEGRPADFPAEAHIQVESGFTKDVEPDGRTGTVPPPVEQANLEPAARKRVAS